jgi:hypothetical protein
VTAFYPRDVFGCVRVRIPAGVRWSVVDRSGCAAGNWIGVVMACVSCNAVYDRLASRSASGVLHDPWASEYRQTVQACGCERVPEVTSVVCPACGAAAGSWCVRHGQVMPGALLACVARVRAVRGAS